MVIVERPEDPTPPAEVADLPVVEHNDKTGASSTRVGFKRSGKDEVNVQFEKTELVSIASVPRRLIARGKNQQGRLVLLFCLDCAVDLPGAGLRSG